MSPLYSQIFSSPRYLHTSTQLSEGITVLWCFCRMTLRQQEEEAGRSQQPIRVQVTCLSSCQSKAERSGWSLKSYSTDLLTWRKVCFISSTRFVSCDKYRTVDLYLNSSPVSTLWLLLWSLNQELINQEKFSLKCWEFSSGFASRCGADVLVLE